MGCTTVSTEYDAVMKTPFGALGVRTRGNEVTGIDFLPQGAPERVAKDALARGACEQLTRYLQDPAFEFDLPLKPTGTRFQQRVWSAIRAIPRGRTLTYGEIARHLESAPRAVGQACGANPYPLVVPCHRVVSSGGSLGGFAHEETGWLPDVKRWLLAHECSQ